jgi:hypothetical protein
VNVTAADFRKHFGFLSDEALLETNRNDLVDIARQCLDEEISRRGLNAAEESAETPSDPAQHEASVSEKLVVVDTFLSGEELNLARGLLEEASIPYHVENPLAALGGIELRLLVPEALEADAREILNSEISEEELAAQAEAAGAVEDETEEELADRDD